MNKENLCRVNLEQINFVGRGLSRPECALAHSSGMYFVPDWTDHGGVSAIFPDGSTKRHLACNWREIARKYELDDTMRGNGICLLEGGEFLIAHLGEEKGGVFRLLPDGSVVPELLEIDGKALPPLNFVTIDEKDRVWITVSTRQVPRAKAYRSDVADGFIAVLEDGKARIVAEGLGYTNECLMHPDGVRLFVNETFARRLTSFDVAENGDLSNRTTISEFGAGTFPDGLAFDENGNAWITSIVSNRVLRVLADGQIETFLEDVDPSHLDWAEAAWRNHSMGRPHLDKAAGRLLSNISNLAFCGSDLNQAVLGCLLDDKLPTIDMPVRGHQPLHWTYDIDPLIKALDSKPEIP